MAELDVALARVPLFQSLEPETIRGIAAAGKLRSYPAGTAIVREDQPGIALYIIVSGKVRVERGSASPQALGELGPGDFFGELAIIEDHARTATVTAVTDTECLLLTSWEFRSLLKVHPSIAIPVMEALIARLHRAEHRPA
jgi:CRP-like cAMP-binding protein